MGAVTLMTNIEICYIKTDEECVELHRFLCLIAQPVLLAPIDAADSMAEVLRIRGEGISLVARCDGEIVGALGLTESTFWFNQGRAFFSDRWLFVFPHFHHAGVASALLAEAAVICHEANVPLIIQGKMKHRVRHIGSGIWFTQPTIIVPAPNSKDAASDAAGRH